MTKKHFRCDYSQFQSEPFENAVCIPLTNGHHTVVSICDFESLAKISWFSRKSSSGKFYAHASINGKTTALSRFLMSPSKGMQVDHINGNPLDNRRQNLRICTHAENQWNKPKLRGEYKGVSFAKRRNRWLAWIRADNKGKTIGYYKTPIEAAKAYDREAVRLHGEFAVLNFPDAPFTANKE